MTSIMRLPGVIGGLGPQTTVDYYLRLQELARLYDSTARPPLLIWSTPLPYVLEEISIMNGSGFDDIGAYIVEGAKSLEGAGADFIVMPCNTLHLLTGRIRSNICIPFISIIDETMNVVSREGFRRIAVLGTGPTVGRGLYDVPLKKAGVIVVSPSSEQQSQLNAMVVRLINNRQDSSDGDSFRKIFDSLQECGIEAVLLACTDFHLLLDGDMRLKVIDTMEVLAQATMREMLG